MSENKLLDLSTEFAVKILNFTSTINGHSSLSNQLERIRKLLITSINTAKKTI